MLEADVIQVTSQALWVAAKVSAPLLVVSLVVGLVVSLLQAVFQVQDQMLAMVPRLVASALVLVACGAWMLREITDWTVALFEQIPSLVAG
jgi:flagellar biosynthetic protein FliQ